MVASHGHAEKRDTLRNLIRSAENFKNAIIFCNRKRDVAILHRSLEKHGFSVGALHGDMDQMARMASLDAFKNGSVALLVCSDVAARGLDIPDVSHVFNFDVPTHSEDYVHRIGRTGRAGRSGVAITLVTPEDKKYVEQIESLIGKEVEWEGPGLSELPPPNESSSGHERRGGERGARRGVERGGRGRSSAGSAAPAREAAPKARAPRASESGRPDAAVAESPRAARTPVYAERRDRRPRAQEDDGPPVIGMGDHVPSFMLRPVVFKPAKVGEE
jgi:superfamily II DNA/RNA helicase